MTTAPGDRWSDVAARWFGFAAPAFRLRTAITTALEAS